MHDTCQNVHNMHIMCRCVQTGQADLRAADVREKPRQGAGDGDADQDAPGQEGVCGQGGGRVPGVSEEYISQVCNVAVMQCSIGICLCIRPITTQSYIMLSEQASL